MTRTTTRARRGFTLVELMVAAAVCVLIMAILASCFQMGIDTMRHLKSTGDMAERLRAASTVIRRDLRAEHFPKDPNITPTGGVRVSDWGFDAAGATKPGGGFFRARSTRAITENADAFNIGSSRADATTGHQLQFTAVLKGSPDQERFYTKVGALSYSSRMAEVAYFLDPQVRGQTNAPSGLPLHQLVRRQRLVAESVDTANLLPSSSNPDTTQQTDDPGVIALKPSGSNKAPALLADLVTAGNRLATGPGGDTMTAGNDANLSPLVNAARLGDDVLLSDVISFEVKLAWTSTAPGEPLPRTFTNNTDQPFDTIQEAYEAGGKTGVTEFDTGASPPLKIRVRAVQIRIRVWDPKLQNTRQTTIVQDL